MDLVPPPALPDEWDLSHRLYGFQCDKWLDHPMPSGPDWFSSEERARRNANAFAYRQKGTKENWNRYLLLGFFVFADCFCTCGAELCGGVNGMACNNNESAPERNNCNNCGKHCRSSRVMPLPIEAATIGRRRRGRTIEHALNGKYHTDESNATRKSMERR